MAAHGNIRLPLMSGGCGACCQMRRPAHALGGDGQLRPAAYDAMTVNERLFAAGLIDDFDRAVRATDVGQAQDDPSFRWTQR